MRYNRFMIIPILLAHAGETHESTIEATAHEIGWYIQLPVFLLALAGFIAILYLLTKKTKLTVLLTASVLLVIGFGFYRLSPVVSATAITLGLVSTLFITLVGLGDDEHKMKEK